MAKTPGQNGEPSAQGGSSFLEQVKAKVARYCAYQERTRAEVQNKLYDLGLPQPEHPDVMEWLEREHFLDEQRFAETFARSQFTKNKWGKIKIGHALSHKGIAEELVTHALETIKPEAYREQCYQLLAAKWTTLGKYPPLARDQKALQYLLRKGYETSLIYEELQRYRENHNTDLSKD